MLRLGGTTLRRSLALFGIAALLAASAMPAAASGPDPATCMVPCGYIYPSIIATLKDVKDKMVPDAIPETSRLHIVFTWDMENEGTGFPDLLENITLNHAVNKKPQWLDLSFEPESHTFLLNPMDNHYEFNTTVTLKLKPDVAPSDATGKKLMILVKSTESGTFKQSFGVEVVKFDVEPSEDPDLTGSDGEEQFAPAAASMAVPVVVALLLLVRRRRQ